MSESGIYLDGVDDPCYKNKDGYTWLMNREWTEIFFRRGIVYKCEPEVELFFLPAYFLVSEKDSNDE